MPAHPEFLAQFDAALRGGPLPAGLSGPDRAEVDRRFAVYRNNVAVGLTTALATRFPVIRRLLGDAFFTPLARLFAETHRPSSPVLAEWGEAFPAFLDRFPPLSTYPYLGDVARIEHARGLAFHAADAAPVEAALLRAADPARIRLGLHPSVRLLSLAHPAVSIWARNQPGGEGLPLASGPETALVLRDAAFRVPVRAVAAGDAALLRAILGGASLSAAAAAGHRAQAGHDPQPLLILLMQAGVIISAKE